MARSRGRGGGEQLFFSGMDLRGDVCGEGHRRPFLTLVRYVGGLSGIPRVGARGIICALG